MAFKIGSGSSISLDSPETMFLDFSDRQLKGLLTHQGRIVSDYLASASDKPDVAFKLPTGSGKTLVGLLIADWRRRKYGERALYVCPTKQLVNQVVSEAHEKYGMAKSVQAFTGRQRDYNPSAKARFQSSEIVGVTTYGGLFNANTFFDEPNLIILDDAHAAENYLVGFWTLTIDRSEHSALYAALAGVLDQVLPRLDARRLRGASEASWDYSWVDKIPGPLLAQLEPEVVAVIDAHVGESKLRYAWTVLRDHLSACQMYLSGQEIVIRPLAPPSLRYGPFASAKQRIYMSATLGEGGDLERLVGVKRIHRLSLPDEFSAQGVGRRFFIFPGRSLSDEDQGQLQARAIERTGRAVVLVPDFRSAGEVKAAIEQLGVLTFSAAEIEDSKVPFVSQSKAVAVLANRYDGIDFPEEQCRLLIMRGLPGAVGLQERFLQSRMTAGLLLQDRIRTRVVQAVGRCTRSLTDYSAVMVLGEELLTYLSKAETRSLLHPELQAEIRFGLEQGGDVAEMLDNLDLFLKRGEEWGQADNEIRRLRGEARQMQPQAMDQLAATAPHEVDYQYALWDGDAAAALEAARSILSALKDPALRGYRALWSYLAGCAAAQLAREGVSGQDGVSREFFGQAARSATSVRWLRRIADLRDADIQVASPGQSAAPLVPRLEKLLGRLGTLHDQKYNEFEKSILTGLAANHASVFEQAQVKLGQLLGFDANKEESEGSPDPWWLVDEDLCFVFEDHSDAKSTSKISVTKARQAASHPAWIRNYLGLGDGAKVIPVLVTPTSACEDAAVVHLKDVAIWKLDEFRVWAINAVQTVRQLRVTYPGEGDMFWRQAAMEVFAQAGADPVSLVQRLQPLRGRSKF